MEMTLPTEDDALAVPVSLPEFTTDGLGPLRVFQQGVADLEETLWDIECIGGSAVSKKIQRLIQDMHAFEPAVTMIGQIKSGKTTLVNAMAGRPGLLPADVNPWTSVVTSLHFNVPRPEGSPNALFRFFDSGEWDHLVENGGRIGELSARAGADKELEKVQKQIAQMREKTKERLGRKFELLLGQEHKYADYDEGLIKRYVCMGDDFDELSQAEKQGLFADITKSADLYMPATNIPQALCIRDTPGVNDTFMMREQITIRSIRDSKICVLVLSAHQALSATDMGLIRLIANVKSRQVVIFVNRIDELSDPATQVPEIEASLRETLATHKAPQDAEIIFGSAYWANAVLEDSLADIDPDSRAALENFAASGAVPQTSGPQDPGAVWTLSGLPQLWDALSERIVESAGERMMASTRRRAVNYVAGLRASSAIVTLRAGSNQIQRMNNAEVQQMFDGIERRALDSLNSQLSTVFDKFTSRTDQAHKRFLERALEALLQHLEKKGENEHWQYSPDGLRLLMRSGYQVMRNNFNKACKSVHEETSAALTVAYGSVFDVTAENFKVEPPEPAEVPAPVTLAQTIALDLKTSWWKSWWGKRRGYRAFASGFYELIEAETSPIVNDLKVTQAAEIRASAEETLKDFLSEQRGILADICEKAQVSIEELHGLFGVSAQEEREELFDMIYEELDIDPPEEAYEDHE